MRAPCWIQRERRLIFENGIIPSILREQHIAFDKMRIRGCEVMPPWLD